MVQATPQAAEPTTVGQSVGHVGHDIVTLAELQFQLLLSDVREAAMRFVRPLLGYAIAALLALTALPIAFVAIALGLTALGLPAGAAFALVAIAGLAAAGAAAAWARRGFQTMPAAFRRSQEEFAHNIAWIKDSLKSVAAPQSSPAPPSDGHL